MLGSPILCLKGMRITMFQLSGFYYRYAAHCDKRTAQTPNAQFQEPIRKASNTEPKHPPLKQNPMPQTPFTFKLSQFQKSSLEASTWVLLRVLPSLYRFGALGVQGVEVAGAQDYGISFCLSALNFRPTPPSPAQALNRTSPRPKP